MPVRKDTGQLESILPDWLKDVRQQARDAAEEEAAQAAAQPRPPANEPPDLLAGLASQTTSADDEDVPDWLASMNPTAKPKSSPPSTPEPSTDFFAQFNQTETTPEPPGEQPPEETLPWLRSADEPATVPLEKDELSAWFTQASGQPEETIESDDEPSETGWRSNFDAAFPPAAKVTPPENEDLSWLRNLEAAARQTGDLQAPKTEGEWDAGIESPATSPQPSGSQDDLSWLDRLGGIEEPAVPTREQPAGQLDDLSWPSQAGMAAEPAPMDAAPNQPIPQSPFTPEEDLDWLNKLGEATQPGQPAEQADAGGADLSWLSDLGQPSQSSQPAAPEDLSWLNQLGGTEAPSTSPFAEADSGVEAESPRQTSPLGNPSPAEPDWLRKAIESPSMPAPGDLSPDWFSGAAQPPEKALPSTPQVTPFEGDIFSQPNEPAPLSNQEVDSLFSVEMPDWLTRAEPGTPESTAAQAGALPAANADELAPVDLPSWVQAMRPIEAVISETASVAADQPQETAGPLAGLHGVLPVAPIGSSRRPKAVSLTLQASEEQQASVLLLEQILASETSPRGLIRSSAVVSQQWLRWVLTALILVILSSIIFVGSKTMPVSTLLPSEASSLSDAVIGIPAGSKVLVVVDYEPSLAGEMEAISGPVLDQLVLRSQPDLSFVSTSPSGAALTERLLTNIGITQTGLQYRNLGYLPGGSAGVLGFVEAPGQIIPAADVQSFSEYAALVVLTDHAESGRVWVEQFENRKQLDPALSNQPLLMVASAQAGPLLQPYVASQQVRGLISGLSNAARYEFMNNGRPGTARSYWDTFGTGLILAVVLIVIGSLWSLFTGLRARRANAE